MKHSNSFPYPSIFYYASFCIIAGSLAVLAPHTIGVKGILALIYEVVTLGYIFQLYHQATSNELIILGALGSLDPYTNPFLELLICSIFVSDSSLGKKSLRL